MLAVLAVLAVVVLALLVLVVAWLVMLVVLMVVVVLVSPFAWPWWNPCYFPDPHPYPYLYSLILILSLTLSSSSSLPLLPSPRFQRYPVESVEMMRCIIDEAESWKVSNPELVLPDEPEASMTSEMEGIASAAVHAAHSLSELRESQHDERTGTSIGSKGVSRFGAGGRGRAHFFVCLGRLTIDHAPLSRRSIVPTPIRDTSNCCVVSLCYIETFCKSYLPPVSTPVATIYLLQ